jgi:probable F420-dependent oxidoreductase
MSGEGGATPAAPPRLVLILSENWTLTPPRDLRALVRIAVEAEDAGFDGVMVSEHVALGPDADSAGLPTNPREFALPGNQDPETPWPDSLILLSAIASATTRIRLVASSVIAPLRHPVLLAKQLATLDLLSGGRLVVQPTVSWHQPEYAALGVPFAQRGVRLDEHLEAWQELWSESPVTLELGYGYGYVGPVYLEPKPFRPGGPPLWFGGETVRKALLRRITRYGDGFNPLGAPSDDDLERLRRAMIDAGRDMSELELVGGVRGRFPDATSVADLGEALESIPPQLARGFGTFCIKPSQFIDDVDEAPSFLRDVVERVAQITSK